jgi:hypothetical protein
LLGPAFVRQALVQIKEYERGWVCAVAADAISVRATLMVLTPPPNAAIG